MFRSFQIGLFGVESTKIAISYLGGKLSIKVEDKVIFAADYGAVGKKTN